VETLEQILVLAEVVVVEHLEPLHTSQAVVELVAQE
jgi:hypothetical protein